MSWRPSIISSPSDRVSSSSAWTGAKSSTAVGVGFKEIVEGLPDDELMLPPGEKPNKGNRQRAFARHYLEKLVNIEVPVPLLTPDRALAMLPGQEKAGQGPEPAPWVRALSTRIRKGYDIARFSVVGLVLGLLCVALISALSEQTTTGTPAPLVPLRASEQPSGQPEVPTTPGPAQAPTQQQQQQQQQQVSAPSPVGLPTPTIGVIEASDLREPRRWLWWGNTVLAVVIVLLWGAGAALRRRSQRVKDSPAFSAALRLVNPLVYAAHGTPRAIKRCQNHTRYLAVRSNPQPPEVDPIERLVFAVGGRLNKSWVPESRVVPPTNVALSEPKLILLGAVEAFDPRLLERTPEEFIEWLDAMPDGPDAAAERYGSAERFERWHAIRTKFRKAPACAEYWPSIGDVRYYRGLVATTTVETPESGATQVDLKPAAE